MTLAVYRSPPSFIGWRGERVSDHSPDDVGIGHHFSNAAPHWDGSKPVECR